MNFILKKHVVTGMGADLFLEKKIELSMSPSIGLQIAWGSSVEVVKEILLNLDTEIVSLWTESDTEVAQTKKKNTDTKMELLSQKVRNYQNNGWNLQR